MKGSRKERMRRLGRENSTSLERVAVLLVLSAFFLLGIYYIVDNPLYTKPDEVYHYVYAVHLTSGKGLPVIDTTRKGIQGHTPLEMEGHQPPLYYATIAAFSSLTGWQDTVTATINPHFLGTPEGNQNPWTPGYAFLSDVPIFFTGRFVSLICGVGALLFSYLLTRLFVAWPLAVLTIAFIGLNPQYLFIATSFSNDMMAVAATHAGLWQLGIVIQKGVKTSRSVILGITVAIATLAKLTGLGLLIPLGAITLWQAWKSRNGRPLLQAGITGVLVLAIDGWWFWRNWNLYGNPFATNLLAVLLGPRTKPWTWSEFKFLLGFLWKAYWLDFSPGGILFAKPLVYILMGLFCILSAVGLVLALIRQPALRPFFLLLWGWFTIVLISLLHLTSKTAIFMGGGRLLFPATVATGATLAIGLTELCRCRLLMPTGFAILLGIYAAIAPAYYLRPVYPRPRLLQDLERSPMHPLKAHFGDRQFELLGYDLQQTELSSQPALTITYYWRAMKKTDRNFSVFIHLQTREEGHYTILTQVDTYPGYGIWPTSAWRKGWIFVDRLTLPLPPSSQPFSGEVVTGLYFLPTMERLPAYDQTGQRFPADAVPLAYVRTDESGTLHISFP